MSIRVSGESTNVFVAMNSKTWGFGRGLATSLTRQVVARYFNGLLHFPQSPLTAKAKMTGFHRRIIKIGNFFVEFLIFRITKCGHRRMPRERLYCGHSQTDDVIRHDLYRLGILIRSTATNSPIHIGQRINASRPASVRP